MNKTASENSSSTIRYRMKRGCLAASLSSGAVRQRGGPKYKDEIVSQVTSDWLRFGNPAEERVCSPIHQQPRLTQSL